MGNRDKRLKVAKEEKAEGKGGEEHWCAGSECACSARVAFLELSSDGVHHQQGSAGPNRPGDPPTQ